MVIFVKPIKIQKLKLSLRLLSNTPFHDDYTFDQNKETWQKIALNIIFIHEKRIKN